MNNRIIFVPQYPVKLRYSEWWISDFENVFKNYFEEVIVLGKNKLKEELKRENTNIFSPVENSINFESLQIKEYLDLKLRKDDILFLSDISFPGLFTQILFHKRPNYLFCFCHGTAKNKYDYYQKDRNTKFKIEKTISKLFNKVFVATNYHKEKLKWNNVEVIGVPKPSFLSTIKYNLQSKTNNIISVSRNCKQKRTKNIELEVENRFGKIATPDDINSWEEYFEFIKKSKIMLISSKEETFGYQVMDAILNDCYPLAPNSCSFPELLTSEFIYNNSKELMEKIDLILNKNINYNLKLRNDSLINNFYSNLVNIIKGELN